MKGSRVKKEKEMIKKGQQIPKIDWDNLEKESREEGTKLYIVIKDLEGNIINKINAPKSKGLNRVAWNLRHSSSSSTYVKYWSDQDFNKISEEIYGLPFTLYNQDEITVLSTQDQVLSFLKNTFNQLEENNYGYSTEFLPISSKH